MVALMHVDAANRELLVEGTGAPSLIAQQLHSAPDLALRLQVPYMGAEGYNQLVYPMAQMSPALPSKLPSLSSQGLALLTALFDWDPALRASPAAALSHAFLAKARALTSASRQAAIAGVVAELCCLPATANLLSESRGLVAASSSGRAAAQRGLISLRLSPPSGGRGGGRSSRGEREGEGEGGQSRGGEDSGLLELSLSGDTTAAEEREQGLMQDVSLLTAMDLTLGSNQTSGRDDGLHETNHEFDQTSGGQALGETHIDESCAGVGRMGEVGTSAEFQGLCRPCAGGRGGAGLVSDEALDASLGIGKLTSVRQHAAHKNTDAHHVLPLP